MCLHHIKFKTPVFMYQSTCISQGISIEWKNRLWNIVVITCWLINRLQKADIQCTSMARLLYSLCSSIAVVRLILSVFDQILPNYLPLSKVRRVIRKPFCTNFYILLFNRFKWFDDFKSFFLSAGKNKNKRFKSKWV